MSNSSPPLLTRPRRKLSNRLASLMRWLHIYTSMFGLAITLFFSVTGITLNHPDWFLGTEIVQDVKGSASSVMSTDPNVEPDKLSIVELLRSKHHIQARLANFLIDEFQCTVSFAGPGYTADAYIDRGTGEYELHTVSMGLVAVLNDLHKGRDTGTVWSWVIDISAILLTAISVTGLALIFWLKRKRFSGLTVALIAAILSIVLIIIVAR